jgi:hypothetical protein
MTNTKGKIMEGIEIESGVPIPQRKSSNYPFTIMNVGDSFFIKTENYKEALKEGLRIRSSSGQWGRRHGGIKFTTRSYGKYPGETPGVRCWRIK